MCVPYWGVKIAEGYDLRGIETLKGEGIKTAREACLYQRKQRSGCCPKDKHLFRPQVCAILGSEDSRRLRPKGD